VDHPQCTDGTVTRLKGSMPSQTAEPLPCSTLLALAKKFGLAAVEEACAVALEMFFWLLGFEVDEIAILYIQ
jgi:hypothetical protein